MVERKRQDLPAPHRKAWVQALRPPSLAAKPSEPQRGAEEEQAAIPTWQQQQQSKAVVWSLVPEASCTHVRPAPPATFFHRGQGGKGRGKRAEREEGREGEDREGWQPHVPGCGRRDPHSTAKSLVLGNHWSWDHKGLNSPIKSQSANGQSPRPASYVYARLISWAATRHPSGSASRTQRDKQTARSAVASDSTAGPPTPSPRPRANRAARWEEDGERGSRPECLPVDREGWLTRCHRGAGQRARAPTLPTQDSLMIPTRFPTR